MSTDIKYLEIQNARRIVCDVTKEPQIDSHYRLRVGDGHPPEQPVTFSIPAVSPPVTCLASGASHASGAWKFAMAMLEIGIL